MKGHYVWMTTGKSLDNKTLSDSSSMTLEENCVKMDTNGDYIKHRCKSTIYYICDGQEDIQTLESKSRPLIRFAFVKNKLAESEVC